MATAPVAYGFVMNGHLTGKKDEAGRAALSVSILNYTLITFEAGMLMTAPVMKSGEREEIESARSPGREGERAAAARDRLQERHECKRSTEKETRKKLMSSGVSVIWSLVLLSPHHGPEREEKERRKHRHDPQERGRGERKGAESGDADRLDLPLPCLL